MVRTGEPGRYMTSFKAPMYNNTMFLLGAKGISCLVVEDGTPGLSFGAQEKKVCSIFTLEIVSTENCGIDPFLMH